jgi:cellulose synthase/poly-beta-1,6-N-acetylglucosamine synthase-like glycosyltransferase
MDLAQALFIAASSILFSFYSGYYIICMFVNRRVKLGICSDKNYRPRVSLIIPVWNEECVIEGKIKNTQAVDYPRSKLEIIVIDSGSTDRTREIVKKFKRVKLIVEKERFGKACALNRAFKHCSGDIVVISDADCRLKRDVLMKSVPYFHDSSVGAVTGRQELINPNENVSTRIEKTYRNYYFIIRNAESILDSTPIFHGEFSAFRRNLLEGIFRDSVADDSELALRIRKKNYRSLLVWNAIYKEYAPDRLSERLKQKNRRAHGLAQIMFRFFSTFFFNPDYGLFGMLIFPAEFFMHVVSPFLIALAILTLPFLPLNILAGILILLLVALLLPKSQSFVLSFLHSQFACLKGIFKYVLEGPSYTWEKINGTRRYRK